MLSPKKLTYSPIFSGVSRSGSTLTNSSVTSSCMPSGICLIAFRSRAMVAGQTSGQFVKPKNSRRI